jgi:monoamine oxidase
MPGAANELGVHYRPLSLQSLLDANFWEAILDEEEFDMQATMLQPVGGMDRIPYAFASKLGETIHYNSPVSEIRTSADSVAVT